MSYSLCALLFNVSMSMYVSVYAASDRKTWVLSQKCPCC